MAPDLKTTKAKPGTWLRLEADGCFGCSLGTDFTAAEASANPGPSLRQAGRKSHGIPFPWELDFHLTLLHPIQYAFPTVPHALFEVSKLLRNRHLLWKKSKT